MAITLFVPAWSFDYWQAWVFLAVFSVTVTLITVRLLKNDPALLERRIKAGPGAEAEKSQKVVQSFAQVFFILPTILAGFDHRLGWSHIPDPLVFIGDVLVFAGLWTVDRVFRENTFTSAIIEVGKNQTVISTGPYAVVRHPMYAGAFVMLTGMPLALASWPAFIPIVLMFAAIIWRLLDEEKFLSKNLTGYSEYKDKVRYRLIPYLW